MGIGARKGVIVGEKSPLKAWKERVIPLDYSSFAFPTTSSNIYVPVKTLKYMVLMCCLVVLWIAPCFWLRARPLWPLSRARLPRIATSGPRFNGLTVHVQNVPPCNVSACLTRHDGLDRIRLRPKLARDQARQVELMMHEVMLWRTSSRTHSCPALARRLCWSSFQAFDPARISSNNETERR